MIKNGTYHFEVEKVHVSPDPFDDEFKEESQVDLEIETVEVEKPRVESKMSDIWDWPFRCSQQPF